MCKENSIFCEQDKLCKQDIIMYKQDDNLCGQDNMF